MSGAVSRDVEFDDDGNEIGYPEYYRPQSVLPAPTMVAVQQSWPTEVRKELTRAFTLYWIDATAAGNVLRGCVEVILTQLGVPRYEPARKGRKRRRRWLDERIKIFGDRGGHHGRLANALRAIKWIGNEGSHASPLSREDVLDGLELLEGVCADLWGGDRQALETLARQINAWKKPRSKRRTKPSRNLKRPHAPQRS